MTMHCYEFGEFRLYPDTRRLFRQYLEIEVTDRHFDILQFFVENPSKILSKDEIIKAVWDGTNVEDNSVERAVVNIRKTLGDDASNPTFVKTVRGRGYLFIAEVSESEKEETPFESKQPPSGAPVSQRRFTQRHVTRFGAGLLILVFAGLLLFAGPHIYGYLTRSVLFSDTFSNGEIAQWDSTGSGIRVRDGIAKISVDKINDGGRLLSKPFRYDPEREVTIESRIKVSFNQNIDEFIQFEGVFGFVAGGDGTEEKPGLFYGVKYGNATTRFRREGKVTTQGFYLVRDNGDILREYHHCNGRVGPKAEAVWSRWFDQKIVYNPKSGTMALYIDGVEKGEFNAGILPADQSPELRLIVYPKGAWLHHAIEIDYLTVTQ